jgi:starch phosphorylase
MKQVRTYVVVPSLPEPLEPLRELAYNLWWSWNHPARELFRRLGVDTWAETRHNPVAMLWQVDQERLEHAARDDAYMSQLHRVLDAYYVYMNGRTWFDDHYPEATNNLVAYFSCEFGLHESLPIYSGGLGVLAGDHLKAASDLGIPLVAVGLMYRQGYFVQQLTEDGWQVESYPNYDFHQMAATLLKDPHGNPVRIQVQLSDQMLTAQVWLVRVGRVNLYLLDSDIPDNPPELRAITARLYGGDRRMRIRQEILLGIGGVRALRAIGIKPTVCHMNEGHAAFLALERIREAMEEDNLSYHEAREAVTGGHVFTTHTPVPAGIDVFDTRMVEEHVGWMAKELGISMSELLALGRDSANGSNTEFCMPILALRLAFRSNAVSKLHGEVARGMWQAHWPGVPREEIPITHITNGVHARTWICSEMADLFDHYLGPNWAESEPDSELWNRVSEIPAAELWRVHVRRREHLIGMLRLRLRDQLQHRGAPPSEVKTADEVLDPAALTIGFARRFAPYKRATLLLRNMSRLEALLRNNARPVQFVFAGKAHPADAAGKELIKQLCATCARPEFRGRMVFLENYDMRLARVLVQGVDVWLNNPLRLHEASGTSGMKVLANGGLNLSCLDGWWPEAFDGQNGWAIGDGRIYDDLAYQDHIESESLYNLLEREIVPLFYDRTVDNIPRKWLERVKESIRTACPVFSTIRMVREYCDRMYVPALRRAERLYAETFVIARQLAAWKARLSHDWHQVSVAEVEAGATEALKVGDRLQVHAKVRLGSIDPADVAVEVYYGAVGASNGITAGEPIAMTHVGVEGDNLHRFEGIVPCNVSGRHGFAVRVVPNHPELVDRYDQGLVAWG